jgi:hypothetical protein
MGGTSRGGESQNGSRARQKFTTVNRLIHAFENGLLVLLRQLKFERKRILAGRILSC